MKINYYFILNVIIIFFCINLIPSCKDSCNIRGIEVSELLSVSAKEKHINYCALLKTALDNNKEAVKELSLLEFYDAAGYDHGSVLVDLILLIGEEKYIESISTFNPNQKKLVKSYIEVGLLYGENQNLVGKNFENSFPKLDIFLR